jgi:hypothetical protein
MMQARFSALVGGLYCCQHPALGLRYHLRVLLLIAGAGQHAARRSAVRRTRAAVVLCTRGAWPHAKLMRLNSRAPGARLHLHTRDRELGTYATRVLNATGRRRRPA